MSDLDYQATFDSPGQVLADLTLSAQQKREILERWEQDEARRQDSTNEGFELEPGGVISKPPNQLAAAQRALALLEKVST